MFESNHKIRIKDYRNILLHCLSSLTGTKLPIRIKGGKSGTKFVICHIPGLSPEDLTLNTSESQKPMEPIKTTPELSFFSEKFSCIVPSLHPGEKDSLYSLFSTLINNPISKKDKQKIMNELKQKKLTFEDLILTRDELLANNYALHSSLEPESTKESSSWLETKDLNHPEPKMYSIDCEFCRSANDKVLTRISVVDYDQEVVLDSYVKPDEDIVDYVTKYSGITEEILADVTTKLHDIQQKLLSFVSSNDILVGHSLESDLNVLKIRHPRIIDTSLMYDHNRGPPAKPALKALAKKHLNISIQEGEANEMGHSSVEDATACIQLLKLKMLEGLLYGKVLNEKTIFDIINNDRVNEDKQVKSSIIDYCSKRYYCNDGTSWKYHVNRVEAENDDHVIDTAIEECQSDTKLVLCKLGELEFNSGWSQTCNNYNGYLREDRDKPMTDEQREFLHQRLNQRLCKLYDNLPASSVLIVFSGTSDPSRFWQLQEIKRSYQWAQRNGETTSAERLWDFDKQTELVAETNRIRGIGSFICVKE